MGCLELVQGHEQILRESFAQWMAKPLQISVCNPSVEGAVVH